MVGDEGIAFHGEVAVVTGAAGVGIGQACARLLLRRGATVALCDNHPTRTAAVVDAIRGDLPGAQVLGVVMDIGDRASVAEGMAAIREGLGPVGLLVNNAALNRVGTTLELDPDDWDDVIRVSLTGAYNVTRVTMPMMQELGGGAIVNVTGLAPDVGGFGKEPAYTAAKGGLSALTRSWAHEGGPHGIRSNAVTMGVISGTKFLESRPEMLARAEGLSPLGRVPTADEVADAVAFLLSDQARSISGETLNVSAGYMMRY